MIDNAFKKFETPIAYVAQLETVGWIPHKRHDTLKARPQQTTSGNMSQYGSSAACGDVGTRSNNALPALYLDN